MRKLTVRTVALLLTLALLLCGCGQQEQPSMDPSAEPSQSDAATEPSQETVETTQPLLTPEELFKSAAFIGDSVTLKLRNYNMQTQATGEAVFLCQGSYSVAHAVENTMLLSFRGQEMTPQDALAACGAERVFILLGMNDIALHGIDKTIENWGKLVSNIRSTCPDIDIIIQSGTPIHKDGQVGSLTNENMDAYNVKLKAFAEANGCIYVDIATQYKNSSNALAEAYCSDTFVHFTDLACRMWVEKLQKSLT